MAGEKVNDYGAGNVDLTSLMTTTDAQRIDKHAVSLTEFSTDTEPEIAEGSKIEVNGALFKFDDDETIDDSGVANGMCFVKLLPVDDSITAEFTNDAPTWDDEKQGWYEAETNNRYLNFAMVKIDAAYIYKNPLPNNDENNILLKVVSEIGDWDMVSDASINFAHRLPDKEKIREISALIRNDTVSFVWQYNIAGAIDDTNIVLGRPLNFDNANFDSTSYNRGWLTFFFEPW